MERHETSWVALQVPSLARYLTSQALTHVNVGTECKAVAHLWLCSLPGEKSVLGLQGKIQPVTFSSSPVNPGLSSRQHQHWLSQQLLHPLWPSHPLFQLQLHLHTRTRQQCLTGPARNCQVRQQTCSVALVVNVRNITGSTLVHAGTQRQTLKCIIATAS